MYSEKKSFVVAYLFVIFFSHHAGCNTLLVKDFHVSKALSIHHCIYRSMNLSEQTKCFCILQTVFLGQWSNINILNNYPEKLVKSLPRFVLYSFPRPPLYSYNNIVCDCNFRTYSISLRLHRLPSGLPMLFCIWWTENQIVSLDLCEQKLNSKPYFF